MSESVVQISDFLLDIRKLADGGIGRFLSNLLRGTLRLLEAGVIDSLPAVLTDAKVEQEVNNLFPQFIQLKIPYYKEFSIRNSLLNLLHPQVFQGRIILSPHISGYLFASSQVVTIHDCIHIKTLPWYTPKALIVRLFTKVKAAFSRDVLTVSQASKRDLVELLGIAERKIKVVPNAFFGAEEVGNVLPARMVEGDYILGIFSNTKLHKNFQALIDVWQARGEVRLVVVAPKGSFVPESTGKFKLLSDISDSELRSLYQNSKGLLIPSLEEGFCLPALEGVYMGAKVYHLRVPAIQELLSDVAEATKISVAEISQAFDSLEDLVREASRCARLESSIPPELNAQVRSIIAERYSPYQMALEYWRAVGIDIKS